MPAKITHGAQQDGVGGAAQLQGGLGQRIPTGIHGGSTDEGLSEAEAMTEGLTDSLQAGHGLPGHLGSDAISWEDNNPGFHAVSGGGAQHPWFR